MHRQDLTTLLDSWLQPEQMGDYAPNGLQVEGRTTIKRVVTGVTASRELIDAAIAAEADAILVHHGYFWKGEPAPIVGMKRARLNRLLSHDINLYAYHLPLDVHPEFGNNVMLHELLGSQQVKPLAGIEPTGIVMLGQLPDKPAGSELAQRISERLGRSLVASEHNNQAVQQLAICTGGGQGFIDQAVAAGADAFITGEVSEPTIHTARECDIQFFAAGHHATERYGVKRLGEKLAAEQGLDVQFIDIDNPA